MEASILEELENLVDMINMLFLTLAVNEDVVDVQDSKFSQDRAKHIGHNALKNGRCIRESFPEDKALIVAHGCAKGSFLYVLFEKGDLMITSNKIQGGEHFGSCQLI
jgi:hypothetical protein